MTLANITLVFKLYTKTFSLFTTLITLLFLEFYKQILLTYKKKYTTTTTKALKKN